jgi:TetR/AcrR family transcriptional regulator, transcriptional repressor of bet genes
MGRPSLAEPRRRQIIDGLRAAIVKHGLADASVQRIAEEADVPTGLIHHYFESKEDLLIATIDQVVEDLRMPLMAEVRVLDPERALARALDFLLLEFPADRERRLLFAEIWMAALRRPQLRKRIAALHEEIVTELTALLDRLPDRARRRAENRDLAMLLLCFADGADEQRMFNPDGIDPRRLRRLADELVARFRGGSHGKADGRAAPDARRLRNHRARRRGKDRRAPQAG